MENYRSLRSRIVASREHAAAKPLARAHLTRQLAGALLLRLVSPSSLFNRHEILFRNPHGHSGHTADYLGLIGMAECPCLLTGMGMRNQGQHAILNFAPPAGVARSNIGEIRGNEAFDLLQLLNTGHAGSLSTVHATSARQALARFTSCVLQSGVDLPYRAIKTNVGDSVNVVVHLERRPGRRFVSEVVEIHGYDPDRDEFNYGFIFDSHKELV